MNQLSWQNPAFLAATLLALLPILIHLIGRKRVEQVAFGAFRFLRKHAEQVVRRHRFLEFLLVLCRCLAIAGLALAFAYPFLRSTGEKAGDPSGGADEVTLILIDNSFSMKAPGRMDEARQRARAVLDKLPAGSAVGVAAFAAHLNVLAPLARDIEPARAAIEKIQSSLEVTHLNLALEEAGRMLDPMASTHRRLVVISDMAVSAWDRKENLRLPAHVKLQLEAVGSKGVKDVCVRRVVVPPVVLAGDFEQDIIVELANESNEPCSNVTVQFSLDDKAVDQRVVNLKAKSASPVRFRKRFESPGDIMGKISIASSDDFPENNEAVFVVPVLPRVQVLLVNGDPDPDPSKNDAFFLSKALCPDPSSPLAVREVPAEKVDAAALKDVDVVMLANVNKLPEAALDALDKFILAGGGIAAFLGKKIVPEEFNAGPARLLPCKLREIQEASPEQPVTLGTVDFSHEIFQPFDGPHNGNFGTARFSRYYEVKDSQSSQVLARFSVAGSSLPSGPPALLARALGRGRSIVFTSSIDLEWNDVCLKAVFLPFVHEVTKWLCRQRLQVGQNSIVGHPVHYPLPMSASEVLLKLPTGATEKLSVKNARVLDSTENQPETAGSVEFTPRERGVYTLNYGSEKWMVAVNLPPEEMETAQFDPREMASAVQAQQQVAAQEVAESGTGKEPAPLRRPLWTLALGMVGLLLGTEMVLATYLARQ